MSNGINRLVLSEIIEKYTTDYGKYIVDEMFPNFVDNLKIVIRRALWALKDTYPSYISSQSALSKTFNYHIHNPDAIYDAIIRMSQDFSVLYPLFDLKGDKGSYSGDKPAAYRYTEIRLSDFAYDVYFKGMNPRILSYKETEDLKGKEPKFLIPKIPMGLILYNHCIGYGFTSKTISYRLSSVLRMLEMYLEEKDNLIISSNREKFRKRIKTLFTYSFPIRNKILNKKDPHVLEGTIDFEDSKTIVVNNLPHGISFSSFETDAISNLLKIPEITGIHPLSSKANDAKLLISLKNSKDKYKNMIWLISKIPMYSNFIPFLSFSKDGHIVRFSDELDILESWYEFRYKSIRDQCRLDISEYKRQIMKLETSLLVKKYFKNIEKILIDSKDDVESRKRLWKFLQSKGEKVTPLQTEHMLNTRIKVINQMNEQKIRNDLEITKNRLAEKYTQLFKIDEIIFDENKKIVKKYERSNKYVSYIPKYIGYIVVNNEFSVWVENLEKLKYYLNIFKDDITSVELIPQTCFQSKNTKYPILGYSVNSSKKLYERPQKVSTFLRYQWEKSETPVYFLIQTYKSKIIRKPILKDNKLFYSFRVYKKPFPVLNIFWNKDYLLIEKTTITQEDLKNKNKHSIYMENINDNVGKRFLVLYWMSDHPRFIRCKYININKKKAKLPVRYGDRLDIVILGIISLDNDIPWYLLDTKKSITKLSGKFILLDKERLFLRVKNEPGKYKDVLLTKAIMYNKS